MVAFFHLWWPSITYGGFPPPMLAFHHLWWPSLTYGGIPPPMMAFQHIWWPFPAYNGLTLTYGGLIPLILAFVILVWRCCFVLILDISPTPPLPPLKPHRYFQFVLPSQTSPLDTSSSLLVTPLNRHSKIQLLLVVWQLI